MTPAHWTASGEPVGLIAGAGMFPIRFAEKARESGIPVVCIGAGGMADPRLAAVCHQMLIRKTQIDWDPKQKASERAQLRKQRPHPLDR